MEGIAMYKMYNTLPTRLLLVLIITTSLHVCIAVAADVDMDNVDDAKELCGGVFNDSTDIGTCSSVTACDGQRGGCSIGDTVCCENTPTCCKSTTDFDGDGLTDYFEQNYNDTGITNGGSYISDDIADHPNTGTGTNPTIADTDGDNLKDGIENCTGAYTLSKLGTCPTETSCAESDPCNSTQDFDGDGLSDYQERNYASPNGGSLTNYPTDINDLSGDTGTNPVDDDSDNDGLTDEKERCTDNFVDADNTGTCPTVTSCNNLSACQNTDDFDNDGDLDGADNCPLTHNPFQIDTDGTEGGDACDTDMDGDNIPNTADACPLRASKTPGVGNGYDANCDHICWRPHAGLPGTPVAPKIDGVVDGPTEVTYNDITSTHQTDIGWRGAHRVVYHNGTLVPHMAFQALRHNSQDYVYLSFEVKNDSLSPNDRVVVIFRPGIDVNAAAGTPFNPKNLDGDIRLIITPDNNEVQVSVYSSDIWSNITMPGNLEFKAAADGDDGWDLEMKVPSSNATSGSAWADFGTHFNFFFSVLRNNYNVAEFAWPDNGHLVNGNIENYLYVVSEWGIGTTDTSACSGVYLTASEIRTDNTPDNSINLLSPNTFFADVKNDSGTTANNINVTFRIADWGITDAVSNNADWREIPSSDPGCPNAGANNNPTCSKNVPVAGETFSLDWTVGYPFTPGSNEFQAERDKYDRTAGGYKHQCIMAELDATSNANITVSSVYRNMNFNEVASVFERKAKISARGLGIPPSGKAEHQFILQESRHEMKPIRSKHYKKQTKKRRATGITTNLHGEYGHDDDDTMISRTQWLVHGYRDTGVFVEIDSVKYPIIDPVSSFGYVITHTGDKVDEWKYDLKGAERIADGSYRLSVPKDGFREIKTRVEAKEKSFWGKLCPWLVLMALGIII